jgi:V/A-type H+-transporting ATPase subunit D
MNLLRTARRPRRVRKGVDLLRRKREALVTELFKLARPAADARARIGQETRRAYPALLDAIAVHGQAGLHGLGWPGRDIDVEIEPGSIWGIAVSRIVGKPPLARTIAARGAAPGSTGPAAAEAAARFEALADLLLEAAPREMLLRRLGQALAATSRQVNTLEQRLAPSLAGQIRRVSGVLVEREREERLRLNHLLQRRGRPV